MHIFSALRSEKSFETTDQESFVYVLYFLRPEKSTLSL